MSVSPGIRVVRGPDWSWENQDGGEGCTGTIIETTKRNAIGTVMVRWDNGKQSNYRIGHLNAYDLRIIDNGPIGVRHQLHDCNFCHQESSGQNDGNDISLRGITGIRWSCASCTEIHLCTKHYMSTNDKCINHQFLRYDSSTDDPITSEAVLVPARKGSRKATLTGLYPGAKVQRSIDWTWEDQDGGYPKTGKLLNIQDWDPKESVRSVALVHWSFTNLSNVYRVGHRGKVDLQYVNPGTNGSIYIEHLPVLGKPQSLSVGVDKTIKTSPAVSKTKKNSVPSLEAISSSIKVFRIGEKVRIVVNNSDQLERLQENHGGFNPKMLNFTNQIGIVHRLTTAGDVRVQFSGYPESNFRWTINPQVLESVVDLKTGDSVRLLEDISLVKSLQVNHGGWAPEIELEMQNTGHVVKVYADGDVRVGFNDKEYTFNPFCLRALIGDDDNDVNEKRGNIQAAAAMTSAAKQKIVQGLRDPSTVIGASERDCDLLDSLVRASAKGDLVTFREKLLSLHTIPSKTITGCLQVACQNGHLEVVKLLVERFPNDQLQFMCTTSVGKDGGGGKRKSPLHMAAHGGHNQIIQYIFSNPIIQQNPLNRPVSLLESRDMDGDTALHYAAYGKKVKTIKFLLEVGADINSVNSKNCSILHISVLMKDQVSVDFLLSQQNININVTDCFEDTALHEAIVRASEGIIDSLCSHPDINFGLVNQRDFNTFQYAALKGNTYAMKKILEYGGYQFAHIPKKDGFTPLHISSLNGHLKAVSLLLHKANVDLLIKDNRGQNSLYCATHQGHADIIVELIKKATSQVNLAQEMLNSVDIEGETPLHIALRREGEPEDAKPYPDVISTLMNSIRSGTSIPENLVYSVSIASYLIQQGAKSHLRNKQGFTPLDFVVDVNAKLFLSQQKQPSFDFDDNSMPPPPPSSSGLVRLECQICCEPMRKDLRPVKFEPCGHTIVCSDCCPRMKKCIECKTLIDRKVVIKRDSAISDDDMDDEIKSVKTLKLHELEKQVLDWEESYSCSICMERKKSVVFRCGHGACSSCVETLKSCHMCRGPISEKINIY